MNIQDSIKTCFIKYIDFTGRASRSEYWWFVLFCLVISFLTILISTTLNTIAGLLLFLPSLAVLVRRLHDTDMSGWWALLLLIPIIGALIIFYFMVIAGTPGPNRFGNPPVT